MDIQSLINRYQEKTDEDLIRLAADSSQLTAEAQSALAGELARRRLDVSQPAIKPTESLPAVPKKSQPEIKQAYRTGEFIAAVLKLYHSHLWFFFKMMAPAVIGGYLTLMSARYFQAMIRRSFLVDGVSFSKMMLESALLGITRSLISWILFYFSFAVICGAVDQIEAGAGPSFSAAFDQIQRSKKPIMKLCLLLFFLVGIAYGITALVSIKWYGFSSGWHSPSGRFVMIALPIAVIGLLFLVISRFALAVPAVLIDSYSVWRAILRSDELTEAKWLTLAALLSKSLIGGYVAAMLPYWLGGWAPSGLLALSWYAWLLKSASMIAVTLVEPPMFIGFAMLYLRMSKELSDSTQMKLIPSSVSPA